MALHRDIYWVGRQWAVTGFGIQACDQKKKGQFDIEAARLWEDGVLESARAMTWLNREDFEKAVSVARQHYPEPQKAPPPGKTLLPGTETAPPEPPKPVVRRFQMQIEGSPAMLVPVWRVRRYVIDR